MLIPGMYVKMKRLYVYKCNLSHSCMKKRESKEYMESMDNAIIQIFNYLKLKNIDKRKILDILINFLQYQYDTKKIDKFLIDIRTNGELYVETEKELA